MLQEKETQRYKVNPKAMVDAAFENAYTDGQDGPAITKPDLTVTVFGVVSMVIMAGMYVATYISKGKNDNKWLICLAICAAITLYIVYKYLKNYKIYKNYHSKDNSKYAKKQEFISLFGEDLPEEMNAIDFLEQISSLTTKSAVVQSQTYKTGVLQLSNSLNSRNNPPDLLCKNMTTYGKYLTQTRHRYYIKKEDGMFIFYDQDFMNPTGEIVCEEKDVLSYGRFSAYPSSINTSGGKIRPDSFVVELDAGNGEKIYFEINGREDEKVKKLFKGIKEVK